MEHRAKLLIWQPLTKHEHLNTVALPHRIDDEYGAPPVVVCLMCRVIPGGWTMDFLMVSIPNHRLVP